MKKIFTLMLAFACALFVGVSCTNDGTDEGNGGTPAPEVAAITFEELAELSHEAGTCNLNFTLAEEIAGANFVVESSAAWLNAELADDGNYLVLTYEQNNSSPKSPAREAVLTVTYGDKAPVTVVVKQASTTEELFVVEFSNVGPTESTLTVHPVNQTAAWAYFTASESSLGEGQTLAEYAESYVALIKDPMGYGGLYGYSEYMGGVGCVTARQPVERQKDEKVYVFVFEVTLDMNMETYEDNSDVSSPIHIYEAEFLPMPSLNVVGGESHTVSCYEGSHPLTVQLTNPLEGGVWQLEPDKEYDWIETELVDGKLNVTYMMNELALSRNAEYTINYGAMEDNPYMGPRFKAYASARLTIVQSKNPYAEVPQYEITVKDNQFNKFVVDVTTSDENVKYVVGAVSVGTLWGKPLLEEIQNTVSSSYNFGRLTFQQGNLVDYTLKLNVNHYENGTLEHYVYAYPVDVEKQLLLAEPTFIEVTVDNSKKPAIKWVAEEGSPLTWNESAKRYDWNDAKAGDVVTLKYEIENPVEGGVVTMNSIYDSNDVVKDDAVVIDQEACTVTFTVDAYNAKKYSHYFQVTLFYKNAEDTEWNWNTQSPTVRVTQATPSAE